MHIFDHILDALSHGTQRVFDTAQGAERYQRLSERLQRLYGALELARLLGSGASHGESKLRSTPPGATSRLTREGRSRLINSGEHQMKTVEIHVTLTDAQAWEFAQFLKRACFSDYRSHATSESRGVPHDQRRREHPPRARRTRLRPAITSLKGPVSRRPSL